MSPLSWQVCGGTPGIGHWGWVIKEWISVNDGWISDVDEGVLKVG